LYTDKKAHMIHFDNQNVTNETFRIRRGDPAAGPADAVGIQYSAVSRDKTY
jgi:hypothetical protein